LSKSKRSSKSKPRTTLPQLPETGGKMTEYEAFQWLAYVADLDGDVLWEKFTDLEPPIAVMNIVVGLGKRIERNPRVNTRLLPRPKPVKFTFRCQCGCLETVTRMVTTGPKPKYKNDSHRQRAYRQRRKEGRPVKRSMRR
jgi:hypothetical protein